MIGALVSVLSENRDLIDHTNLTEDSTEMW